MFGARGTGKSTFVQSLFSKEDTVYIDLLKYDQFEQLLLNPDSLEMLITKDAKWVIIDEIQKVPKLLDTVHRLIENSNVKFILTGSSARKLKVKGVNLLAGRAFVYNMFPFSAYELGDKFQLSEIIKWGALPNIFKFEQDEEKKLFLESYAQTYLREEIWEEQLIRNILPFRRFLEVAAQCNGTVINYSNIANDVRVDTKTVQSYFQILEDTLITFMLEPYHASLRKRQRANPKVYFFDLGIVRALTHDFSLDVSPSSLGFGCRFEHFLICELFRLNHYFRKNYNFSFIRESYKNGNSKEVDIVLERPGLPLALVEIKSTNCIREDHLVGLKYFASKYPKAELYCLSLDNTCKQSEKVKCLHWQKGIEELGLGMY